MSAVADDADAVGDFKHLFEPMRDIDDADAGGGEVTRHTPQFARFMRGKRRGRLVHDEHAHVLAQGARDFDSLLLRQRQSGRHAVNIEIDSDSRDQRARLLAQRRSPQQPSLVDRRNEDVLGHVEVGKDHRLLIDGGDALQARGLGAVQRDGLPVDLDASRRRLVDPVMILMIVDLPERFSPTIA